MGKKESDEKNLEKAVEANIRKEAMLSTIEPVIEVRDVEHAKSPEVLQFVEKELAKGTTWNEVRALLGLGPAKIDKRWRVIRDQIFAEEAKPNLEELIKDVNLSQAEILYILHEKLMQLGKELKEMGTSEEEIKTRHHFFKMEIDVLQKMLMANQGRLGSVLKTEKHKFSRNGKFAGINIHIHTRVPRPTEEDLAKAREVRDINTGPKSVIEAKKAISRDKGKNGNS